jgi:hypothetical protein
MSKVIPIQESLRPALPEVFGCKDYREEKQLLERVDRILVTSGIEQLFLELSMERFEAHTAQLKARGQRVQDGDEARTRHLRHSRRALRCTLLKQLTQEPYRGLSKALAGTPLYRWFCRCEDFEFVQVPGKSTLQDYAHWLEHAEMERVLAALTAALGDEQRAQQIGLEMELDLIVAWVDTTCLKAKVHFPTDWVLLRDAMRTLLQCIEVIRRHGLRKRMPTPAGFLREVNALAMGMSAAARRKPGAKKERKRWLRLLKRLTKVVEAHGQRYRQALDEQWEKTDLTRKQAEVILRRMDNILGQLPAARRQAHERIIGHRPVANADKILSLYEPDIHVIVRGKAGAEVEFGNSLLLAESAAGYILDHELLQEASPGDTQWLTRRLPMIRERSGGKLCGVAGDRGFDSKGTADLLEEEELFNAICPRNPRELSWRIQHDPIFARAMHRRAGTEGRIGILKNVFLGGTPLAKGFKNRQLQVAWAVLAHNLWVAARLPWAQQAEHRRAA